MFHLARTNAAKYKITVEDVEDLILLFIVLLVKEDENYTGCLEMA